MIMKNTMTAALLLMFLLPIAGASRSEKAWAQPAYESQPVLKASAIVPPALLSGPQFKVDEHVPTTDFLTRFTLKSDFGSFPVVSREMLAIRVSEVGALEQLRNTSKTEEFLKAAGNAAARPVESAANIVANPVETAKATPAAVGRFFDRVGLGAKSVAESATQSGKSADEAAADVTKRVGGISATTLGYEQERRALAKKLGVDPYTTNKTLAKQLDDVAWVAFSGRMGMGLLTAVVVPFSSVLTVTTMTNNLVWDTPPADLMVLNGKKVVAMGASEAQAQALGRNPWYSLTMLTALITALDRLEGVPGREQVVVFAARSESEEHSRLVVGAVQMLAHHHATVARLSRIAAPGPIVGHTGQAILVPVPLDFVAWTERVGRFSRRADLAGKPRTVWITGAYSARAKRELGAAGWTVLAGSEPAKGAR